MKIEVKQAAPDVFSLTFDGTEIALEGRDLKNLLLQVTKVLAPAVAAAKPEDRSRDFLRQMKNANNIGIQKFLMSSDQKDVLVLLKVAEKDQVLLDKFYGNMSERLRKILAEDLAYKFKDGVSPGQINSAFTRLMETAASLEKSGTLAYENAVNR